MQRYVYCAMVQSTARLVPIGLYTIAEVEEDSRKIEIEEADSRKN